MGDSRNQSVPTGRLKRLTRLAKMAPAAGLALLRPRDHDGLGRVLTDTLGKLKGGSMKVGQVLAQIVDDLPPALRTKLTALYGAVPALPIEQVREVLASIGGVERFAEFDETPIAAASLGQVHAARLPDGTAVAVKVQYPGVDQALREDLELLRRTQRTITAGGLLFDASGYFEALRELTLRELDYVHEADARDALADAVQPFPALVVPEVHRAYSSDRVLTLERLVGPMLHDWAAGDHPPSHRDALGRRLVDAVLGPVAVADLANADAHPGNFVVLDDGRLGLLDYGAVTEVPAPRIDALLASMDQLRDPGDGQALAHTLRDAGFVLDLPDPRAAKVALALADALGASLRGVHDFAADPPMTRFVRFKIDHPIESVAVRPTPPILPILRASLGLAHGLRLLRARVDLAAAIRDLSALRASRVAPS